MLLATLRSQPNGAAQLLFRQVMLRHASKTTKGSSNKKSSKVQKADRSHATNTSSTSNSNSSSSSNVPSSSIASDASIAEHYVPEKVIYEMGPNEKVADARLLLGFGLMFCIFVSELAYKHSTLYIYEAFS